MKITVREVRNLVRAAVLEEARKVKSSKRKRVNESKTLSIKELRSMVKRTIAEQMSIDPEVLRSRREEQAEKVLSTLTRRVKGSDLKALAMGQNLSSEHRELLSTLEDGDDAREVLKQLVIDGLNGKSILGYASSMTPKAIVNLLNKKSSDLSSIDKVWKEREKEKKEEIYIPSNLVEDKLKEIAEEFDVSKQMAAKIVDSGMKKIAQLVSLSAGGKFRGKESADIAAILKTVRKGDYVLKLKQEFEEALSGAYGLIEEVVLEEAEKFIDTLDAGIDFPFADYDSLAGDEKEMADEKILSFLDSMGITDATDEEFSFVVDLIDFSHLEENKEALKEMYFKHPNPNVPFARIAAKFSEQVQPVINRQFNPETRGRGSVDPEIERAVQDLVLDSD